MLGAITGWFRSSKGPTVSHPSLHGLSQPARRAALDMTRGLSADRQESACKMLAEFGDQGIMKFHDFGVRFKQKKLSSYDDTAAYYTGSDRRVTLNKREDWNDEEGATTLRHELFHALDHIQGQDEFPDSWGTKFDSFEHSGLTFQDKSVQGLYDDYRARCSLQHALDYRDAGELPEDDNPFTGKENTTIEKRGNSFVVDTDPTWFSRQHGPAVALGAAVGVGLMAVGGVLAPLAGLAVLGASALGGRRVAKEAVGRVFGGTTRTMQDGKGHQAVVKSQGDRFVVTAGPEFQRTFQEWSEYAMLTDMPSEYFAEAGSYVLSGGVRREAIELTDPKMADYARRKFEAFSGLKLPDSAG